jgi:hypothetical protein
LGEGRKALVPSPIGRGEKSAGSLSLWERVRVRENFYFDIEGRGGLATRPYA